MPSNQRLVAHLSQPQILSGSLWICIHFHICWLKLIIHRSLHYFLLSLNLVFLTFCEIFATFVGCGSITGLHFLSWAHNKQGHGYVLTLMHTHTHTHTHRRPSQPLWAFAISSASYNTGNRSHWNLQRAMIRLCFLWLSKLQQTLCFQCRHRKSDSSC